MAWLESLSMGLRRRLPVILQTEAAECGLPDTPAGEPVFAITVRLKKQTVTAYGQGLPLQAGMRLDADILQETRRLYEWMLEPLYSITGKM